MSLRAFIYTLSLYLVSAVSQAAFVDVRIDLSKQKMDVIVVGYHEHTWDISSARRGYKTPTGKFRPNWMTSMHYSEQYDFSPMPHSIFFHEGYAIHGTNEIKRLGRPASHGCVRLSPENARTLYQLVKVYGMGNTKIVVKYKQPIITAPSKDDFSLMMEEEPF